MSTDRMDEAMAYGTAQYADVIAHLQAAGLPATFTQTGGMCAALEVTLDNGQTLLITDAEDTLSWDRDTHQGWSVGRYPRHSEYDDGPLAFETTEDGSLSALLPLVHTVLGVTTT
ncbi:hypothetical protein [uncultured Pseudokineococcus sp.]|uniref:hypothetical protein n=1 Tax=uncultured Pseudokineococcus sp. TaxID=1642928 RepID=UPI002616341C|nr:hypothetical protein [uncultured Pseudokineococcus sp.]